MAKMEYDSFTVLIVADFPFAFAFLVPAFPFAFAFGRGAFFFAVVVAVACNFLAASSDARRCVFSVSFFNFSSGLSEFLDDPSV